MIGSTNLSRVLLYMSAEMMVALSLVLSVGIWHYDYEQNGQHDINVSLQRLEVKAEVDSVVEKRLNTSVMEDLEVQEKTAEG